MGKINSSKKGKSGELEFAHFLKDAGFTGAHRGQQFKGTPDSPDVICPELEEILQFEVKRTEALSLYKALEQAEGDAGTRLGVVAHRRNRKKWIVALDAAQFLSILKLAYKDVIPAETTDGPL